MTSPAPSIYYSESYFTALESLVPPPQVLKREGYRLVPFKPEEISGLVRCKDCLGMFCYFVFFLFNCCLLFAVCYRGWLMADLLVGREDSQQEI